MSDVTPSLTTSDTQLQTLLDKSLSSSYELDRELGRGGMGIVYKAKDRRLKRSVAIKLLPPELAYRSEIRTRFLREAETAAQLSHPNIVPIYSVDERDGLVYFVMACVDGDTVAKRLHDLGPFSHDETNRILREVADALAYAHGRGVIHRDVKPDNILLDGETGRAMVTDFGIARAVQEGGDSRLTATGMAIGTPAYMSPEQAAGDRVIDGRADLYSLGIVAYQMLTGELPLKGASTPAMLMKHLTERPRPVSFHRPDVPPELDRIVMTLLEKEPDARFPSAGALVAALQGDHSVIPAARGTTYGGQEPGGEPSWLTGADRDRAETGRGTALAHAGAYGPAAEYEPTSDDILRWTAEPVQNFRRKFIYYAVVNAAIILVGMFSSIDLFFVPVFWTIYMAMQYAGLWTQNYDWRDVARQPGDRQLVDVAQETVDEVWSVFDETRREKVRSRRRSRRTPLAGSPVIGGTLPGPSGAAGSQTGARRLTGGGAAIGMGGGMAGGMAGGAPGAAGAMQGAPGGLSRGTHPGGPYFEVVRKAEADRAEVLRMVNSLPSKERGMLAEAIETAAQLCNQVRALASSLAASDRTFDPRAMAALDQQIAELEAQANPLERESDDRVRRLAKLRVARRAAAEQERRRSDATTRLERSADALSDLRLTVVKLRAGSVAPYVGEITTLTERARVLAADVDAVVSAADEVGRLRTSGGTGKRPSGGARP